MKQYTNHIDEGDIFVAQSKMYPLHKEHTRIRHHMDEWDVIDHIRFEGPTKFFREEIPRHMDEGDVFLSMLH